MAIDWSRYTPGGTNLPRQQLDYTSAVQNYYGSASNSVPKNYDEMYQQAKNGTIPRYSVSPFDVYDAAGIQGTGQPMEPTTEIVNTQRSLQDVYNEAYANYLARSTEQRDLARQGIMAAGQDRYQQARMAMEQQRALSDTRGLTAGAREGAEAQTSAAQQVALNQIESNTRNELMQLKAQGIQDEFLGEQYAMQKLDQFKQMDPGWGRYESLSRDYQDALTRGDAEAAEAIRGDLRTLESQLLGFSDLPEYTDITSTMSLDDLDADVTALAERLSQDPSGLDKLAAVGLFLGGTALLVGGILSIPFTGGVSFTTVAPAVGMITAAAGAYTAGSYITAVEGDQQMSVADKKAKIDAAYAQERTRLINLGYPAEEIDRIITEARQELPPALR